MQQCEFELYFLESSFGTLSGDSHSFKKFLSSFNELSSLFLWCMGVFLEIEECTVDVDSGMKGVSVFWRDEGTAFLPYFTLHSHVSAA